MWQQAGERGGAAAGDSDGEGSASGSDETQLSAAFADGILPPANQGETTRVRCFFLAVIGVWNTSAAAGF